MVVIQGANICTVVSHDKSAPSPIIVFVAFSLGPGILHNWRKLHSIPVAISLSSKISVGHAIVDKLIEA